MKIVQSIARHQLLVATMVSSAFFIALAVLVPTARLIEALNAVFLGLAVLVGFIWLPGLVRALRQPGQVTRVAMLAGGIGLVWASTILQRLLSFWWRLQGRPEGWSDSLAWAVAVWVAMMGAILHLVASGMDEEGRFKDPERVLVYLGVPVIVAATITYLAFRGG